MRNICVLFGLSAGLLFGVDTWTLKTGPVEYRLRQEEGAVRLEYFGPAGLAPWKMGQQRRGGPLPSEDLSGIVEGLSTGPEDLELKFAERGSGPGKVETLRMRYQHRHLPLEIEAVYSAWGDTGVISRKLKLTNRG